MGVSKKYYSLADKNNVVFPYVVLYFCRITLWTAGVEDLSFHVDCHCMTIYQVWLLYMLVYSACFWELYTCFLCKLWNFLSYYCLSFPQYCCNCSLMVTFGLFWLCISIGPPASSVQVWRISVRLNSLYRYSARRRMDGIIMICNKWFPVIQMLTSVSRSSVVNMSVLVALRLLIEHGKWWWLCH